MTGLSEEILFTDEALIPENYRLTTSRLGQSVELASDSQFYSEITIFDSNSSITKLHPRYWMSGDEELDRVMRPFLKRMIERYMPRTLISFEKQISLFIDLFKDSDDLNESLNNAVLKSKSKGYKDISPLRQLIRWFIAYEVDGLELDIALDILRLEYGGNQNSYLALYGLDAESGPFLREELRILHQAALNPNIHLEDRVVLKLCLEFGLRPIQIALLKQSDFILDTQLKLAYLNIPRVKQKHQYRRVEFTNRLVSDELAQMIIQLIDVHELLYSQGDSTIDYSLNDAPLIMRRHSYWHGDSTNNPYILANNSPDASKKLISNQHGYFKEYAELGWQDITHHIPPQGIDYRLDSIAKRLPLSPRTGRPFQMNAYRFRYTLGTNAVIEGATEIEVASLLDHSSLGSVKHYFHYSQEMFEVLEAATLDRVENKFWTAAWSKHAMEGNVYDVDIVEPETAITLGKCQKGSPCTLEPAVACYGCDKFCPTKDVEGHRKALNSLTKRAEKAAQSCTRAVAHQFDEAIAGCTAAIAYAEGEEVFSIQDVSDSLAISQKVLESANDE